MRPVAIPYRTLLVSRILVMAVVQVAFILQATPACRQALQRSMPLPILAAVAARVAITVQAILALPHLRTVATPFLMAVAVARVVIIPQVEAVYPASGD